MRTHCKTPGNPSRLLWQDKAHFCHQARCNAVDHTLDSGSRKQFSVLPVDCFKSHWSGFWSETTRSSLSVRHTEVFLSKQTGSTTGWLCCLFFLQKDRSYVRVGYT